VLTFDQDEVWTKVVALVKSFPTACHTPPAHKGIRPILDFPWSGVKLPIWLLAFLLAITYVGDVQMGHASPFWTSTLQYLSNDINNASMRGVLTLAIKLWTFGSLEGLPSPHFGGVSLILTLSQSKVTIIFLSIFACLCLDCLYISSLDWHTLPISSLSSSNSFYCSKKVYSIFL
jgi:hypothetical protein